MGRSTKKLYTMVFVSVAIVAAAVALFVILGMTPFKTITFKNSNFETVKLKQGDVIDNLPEITQEGYIFYGWYYSEDLSEENKVKQGIDVISSNIELYPKIQKGIYTITYDINGADSDSNVPEPFTAEFETVSTTPYASVVGIHKYNPEYGEWGDMVLKYWSTNPDGSGDRYEQGDKISVPGRNITLYAHWSRMETRVLFYPNGGAYINELIIFTGTIIPEKDRVITVRREGYHFVDWYEKEEITESDLPYDFEKPVAVDTLRLYAHWEPNKYLAKFYADYETLEGGGEPWRTVEIFHDGFVSDPKEDFKNEVKKDGLYFKHWAVGNNVINSPFNFDKKVTGGVEVFAIWTTEVTVDNETSADCFTYTETDNEVTITGLSEKGLALTSVVIPHKINLKNVVEIKGINSNNLNYVALPQTLKNNGLGDDAFIYSSNIVSYDFVGANEYYKTVDGVLFNKDGSILYRYPANKDLLNYVVPSETSRIAPYAFSMSKKLDTLDVNVSTIDMMAFNNSTSIKTLRLGSKVANINENTFREFKSLQFIEIENNNNFVVINGILYKQEVVNGSKVPTTAIKCFNKNENARIILPETVTLIDGYAFQYCSNIIYLEFGAGVIRYGDSCLDSLTSLKELKFNNPNATGVTIRGSELIFEKYALEKIYAYKDSFMWNELSKKPALRDILQEL